MSIEIREASRHDFPAVCGIMRADLGVEALDEQEAVRRFERIAALPDWRVFVAVADGETVGFLSAEWRELLHHRPGSYAEIMALAVSGGHRRSGAGAKLVAAAEAWAREHGASEMVLHSQMRREGAHLFYQRQGYQKKSFFFRKIL